MRWFGLILLSWLVTEFSGYMMHRLMHVLGLKIHEAHHKLYPTSSYIDDTYREPHSAAALQMCIYAIPALLYMLVLLVVWNVYAAVLASSVIVATALWTQYVHDSMHVRGVWLEKFKWFWELRLLHWIHHDTEHNFGITMLFWDRVFGSFRPVDRELRKHIFESCGVKSYNRTY